VNPRVLPPLAMTAAGLMISHQVVGKAVRDATFLSAWPATALPTMVIATAVTAVLAVPVYTRLLATFSPRIVVPTGFLLSAIGHAIEWRLVGDDPWGAVIVYLHLAALSALLLSGFWSLVSELFDPQTAKVRFGQIAAAGTLGGIAGGFLTARLASTWPADAPLLFLAFLHVACAGGVLWLARSPSAFPPVPADTGGLSGLFRFDMLRQAPHLRTLALMIVTSTAGAAIVDFLLKAEAARPENFGSRTELLEFFAIFYTVVQLLTFLVQTGAGRAVRRFGLGRTISTLPAGLGVASGIAMLYPTIEVFAFVRGFEAVLRGSTFRSGYELLFVPMDPVEKRRTKTFLDVTCDRVGDAFGALLVWLLLFTNVAFQKAELVATVIAFSLAGLWLARRLDSLYLHVVERHLVKQGGITPVVIGSETGWSVLEWPSSRPPEPAATPKVAPSAWQPDDPYLRVLKDLRSGNRALVDTTLTALSRPDSVQMAQVIQLLAWDDVAPHARRVLERGAAAHAGALIDALLNPDCDFAVRRRIPRVLSTVSSERALDGLARGLDDARFEVRYQCGRAIDRILARTEGLSVAAERILAAVDRELSVSPTIWHGHQLIDRLEVDEATGEALGQTQRNLEHVFTLLSAVLPREPLQIAYRGTQSNEQGLRGLAIEYLDGILPAEIRTKLWALMDARPEPRPERQPPEQVLERLRRSTQMHLVVARPTTRASGDVPAQSDVPPTITDASGPR
jgi:AAA family ATP:ADP antiporter